MKIKKEEAIKWHMEKVKIYKGYDENGNRIELNLTREKAEAEVNDRIQNNLPLTGFNDQEQSDWTY